MDGCGRGEKRGGGGCESKAVCVWGRKSEAGRGAGSSMCLVSNLGEWKLGLTAMSRQLVGPVRESSLKQGLVSLGQCLLHEVYLFTTGTQDDQRRQQLQGWVAAVRSTSLQDRQGMARQEGRPYDISAEQKASNDKLQQQQASKFFSLGPPLFASSFHHLETTSALSPHTTQTQRTKRTKPECQSRT